LLPESLLWLFKPIQISTGETFSICQSGRAVFSNSKILADGMGRRTEDTQMVELTEDKQKWTDRQRQTEMDWRIETKSPGQGDRQTGTKTLIYFCF
jgi:hypothetical protein